MKGQVLIATSIRSHWGLRGVNNKRLGFSVADIHTEKLLRLQLRLLRRRATGKFGVTEDSTCRCSSVWEMRSGFAPSTWHLDRDRNTLTVYGWLPQSASNSKKGSW
jgi:hypothetical protein